MVPGKAGTLAHNPGAAGDKPGWKQTKSYAQVCNVFGLMKGYSIEVQKEPLSLLENAERGWWVHYSTHPAASVHFCSGS